MQRQEGTLLCRWLKRAAGIDSGGAVEDLDRIYRLLCISRVMGCQGPSFYSVSTGGSAECLGTVTAR